MGMSTVPLSELYAGAAQYLEERGGSVFFNTCVEGAAWDEEAAQWTLRTRTGELTSDFLVLALPFEATAKLLPHMPPPRERKRWRGRSSGTSTGPSAASICGSTARLPSSITPCCWTARFTGSITRAACNRAQGRAVIWNWWSAPRGPLRRSTARQAIGGRSGTGRILSAAARGEAGKGRAGQGDARHLRRPSGHRCGAAPPRFALAATLSRRRLDGHRLAFDDGERGALRPPGR